MVGEIQLADGGMFRIPLIRLGTWDHPWYGEVVFDEPVFQSFVDNFANFTTGVDLAVNAGHEFGMGALAWIKDVVVEDDQFVLYAEPTDAGLELIPSRYKYASAEYKDNYVDAETGEEFGPTLTGAAVTNRPFIHRQQPITILSEDIHIEQDATPVVLVSQRRQEMDPITKVLELDDEGAPLVPEPIVAEPVVVEPEVQTAISLQADDGSTVTLSGDQVLQMLSDNRELRADRHNTRVLAVIDKAKDRGVAPAVIDTATPILQACSEGAEATITLSIGGEDRAFNYFTALARLLEMVPGHIGELSVAPTGQPIGTTGKKLTMEEAEANAIERRNELRSYLGSSSNDSPVI